MGRVHEQWPCLANPWLLASGFQQRWRKAGARVGLEAFVEGAVVWRADLTMPFTPAGFSPFPSPSFCGLAAETPRDR